MNNYFIVVIILMAITIIYYNTQVQYMTDKKSDLPVDIPATPAKPIYLNLNIKDICQNLKDSDTVSAAPENSTVSETKSLADQLLEQKKMYNELKLKYDDDAPVYKYTNSDLYLIDNQPQSGDDVFTNRMIDMGMQAKVAVDARSMYSKNSLLPYLEDELEESAGSGPWWDQDTLEQAF